MVRHNQQLALLLQRIKKRNTALALNGLNPIAVKAMAEKGIDISQQTSDIIDQDILNDATLVVTLCGDAADKCPVTPSSVQREHWGFDDPAKTSGTEEDKWVVFQTVRDEIEARIRLFAREQN